MLPLPRRKAERTGRGYRAGAAAPLEDGRAVERTVTTGIIERPSRNRTPHASAPVWAKQRLSGAQQLFVVSVRQHKMADPFKFGQRPAKAPHEAGGNRAGSGIAALECPASRSAVTATGTPAPLASTARVWTPPEKRSRASRNPKARQALPQNSPPIISNRPAPPDFGAVTKATCSTEGSRRISAADSAAAQPDRPDRAQKG